MMLPYPRPAATTPRRGLSLLVVLMPLLATLPAQRVLPVPLTPAAVPATPAASITEDFGRLPLAFVPNAGQANAAVRFLVHAMGGTIFFADAAVVLALPREFSPPHASAHPPNKP
jgi:hypothetical protein